MRRFFYVLSFCFLAVLICSSAACAAGESDMIGAFTENFEAAIKSSGVVDSLFAAAKKIFSQLMLLMVVWRGYQIFIDGRASDLSAWVISMCQLLIYACLATVMMVFAPSWIQQFADTIVGIIPSDSSSYSAIAKLCAELSGAPHKALADFLLANKDKLEFGVIGFEKIYNLLNYIGTYLAASFAGFIICIPMVLACFTLVVARCELYIACAFAVLGMGFAGSTWTKDIAVSNIKHVLSCAVKILAINVLIAVTRKVVSAFTAPTPASWDDCYALDLACIFVACIIWLLFKTIPNSVAAPFGGGGGGADASGVAATATMAMGLTSRIAHQINNLIPRKNPIGGRKTFVTPPSSPRSSYSGGSSSPPGYVSPPTSSKP